MINFISVNNNNLITFVHKDVFLDVIKTLSDVIEDIKIDNKSSYVEFVQNNKNVVYFINVKLKKGINISSKICEIEKKVITHTKLLLNKIPQNVIINFIGEF